MNFAHTENTIKECVSCLKCTNICKPSNEVKKIKNKKKNSIVRQDIHFTYISRNELYLLDYLTHLD